jgi:hypothetical protein
MHAFARTAATVAVALAAGSAAGCSAASGPQASASSSAAVTSASRSASPAGGGTRLPSSVPRDYVTIDPVNPAHLIVRATATGAAVATVSAPPGTTAAAVYGSGNGQVFAIATTPVVRNPGGGQVFYLLRLRSGAPAPLRRLPVGHEVGPGPTAVALSPDGSKIAIAFTYLTYPPNPQPLVVYGTATGAALRTWTVSSGIIGAADPMAGGDRGQDAGATSMRWTADGRGLAFAFHAKAAPGKQGYGYDRTASIRLVQVAAPDGDLIARSREVAAAIAGYNPGNGAKTQCLVADGWSVSADGLGITCAAEFTLPGGHGPGTVGSARQCPGGPAAGAAIREPLTVGFWRQFRLTDGGGGGETIYGLCPTATTAGIQLFWASPDGKTVLGILRHSGFMAFGLFSGGRDFIPLALPPGLIPAGMIAW